MRRDGVRALFLSTACSDPIRSWAVRAGVRLLSTDPDHQRRFEHKLWFDAFLRAHDLPRPRGGVMTLGRRARFPAVLSARASAVVQEPESVGGEGTWFVDGAEEVDRLADAGVLRRGRRYLVREFIDGRPFGISVFVAPGTVALSAARLQCYNPCRGAGGARVFAGIQWVPTDALSPMLRRNMQRVFTRLGDLLYRRRYFGFANFDFMVDARDRLAVIECNPRMSAATPQVLLHPALLGGVDAGRAYLDPELLHRSYPRACRRRPLPRSSYRGATLDLVSSAPAVITRGLASGRYRWTGRDLIWIDPDLRRLDGDNELAVIGIARPGQRCQPGETLASVMANFALHDDHGAPGPPARRLLELLQCSG